MCSTRTWVGGMLDFKENPRDFGTKKLFFHDRNPNFALVVGRVQIAFRIRFDVQLAGGFVIGGREKFGNDFLPSILNGVGHRADTAEY